MNYHYPGLMTEEQYLRVEEVAREKSEYVAGQIFLMSGVTLAHNRITLNLFGLLQPLAKKQGCSVHVTDVKVKVKALDCFYYPDVSVTCEPFVPSALFVLSPRLLIEVLSPSTESIDRREKLIAYRSIDALNEYVIAHQDKAIIEVYKRVPDEGWTKSVYENNEHVVFESFTEPVEIPLAQIYDWMDLSNAPEQTL